MNRIKWIDCGKGLTIFFVLVVHVLEGLNKTNLYNPSSWWLNLLQALIFTFIMPIFFALSGYLYHRVVGIREYVQTILKKLIGLGIPYILFTTFYVVLQHFSDDNVHNLISWHSLGLMWWQPVSYLWFLYALFFIFVLVGIMDLLKVSIVCQCLVYLTLFIISQVTILPFALSGTFTWVLPFYLGFLYKNYAFLKSKKLAVFMFIVALASFVTQSLILADWYDTNELTYLTFISKMASIFVGFALFQSCRNLKIGNYFSKFGIISMTIYLVHAPTASIVRVILFKLGISVLGVQIFLGILIVWYFSIFINYLALRIKLIDFMFYPLKYIKIKYLLN